MKKAFWFVQILFGVGLSANAFGCGVISPRHTGMRFFASYENGFYDSYGTGGNSVDISGCGPQSRGKYIMLAMGPDIISSDYHRANSYTGYFLNDRCSIVDSPLDPGRTITYEKKLAYYKNQTKTLQTCLEAVVVDHSRLGLNLPESQNGCTVLRTGKDSAVMRGGYCFLRISPDSEFKIQYNVRAECAQSKFLRDAGLAPIDFNSSVSLYLAGDASGHSTDLTQLEMIDTRFTIQPASDLIKLSTNFGSNTPRWPAAWVADVHMADFKIKSTDFPELATTFLIDNQCPTACKDGLCTGPCDFMIPGAAEGRLYKLPKSGKAEILDVWYQGGIVPAHWQGLIPGETHSFGYQPFVAGERYRLSFKFGFPDTYFRIAKDGFRQFLIKLSMPRAGDISVRALPALEPMTGLAALYRELPGVKPLPALQPHLRNLETSWQEPLATLASYLDFEGWPPYYEDICSTDLKKCLQPYNGGGQTMVSVDFTVTELTAPEYKVKDLIVRRESDILPIYERAVTKVPHVECQ